MDNVNTDPGSNEGGALGPAESPEMADMADMADMQNGKGFGPTDDDSHGPEMSKDNDSVRSVGTGGRDPLEVPGDARNVNGSFNGSSALVRKSSSNNSKGGTASRAASRAAMANKRRKRARTAGKNYDSMMKSRTRLVYNSMGEAVRVPVSLTLTTSDPKEGQTGPGNQAEGAMAPSGDEGEGEGGGGGGGGGEGGAPTATAVPMEITLSVSRSVESLPLGRNGSERSPGRPMTSSGMPVIRVPSSRIRSPIRHDPETLLAEVSGWVLL